MFPPGEGLVPEGGGVEMDLGDGEDSRSVPQVIGKGCYGRREASMSDLGGSEGGTQSRLWGHSPGVLLLG